MLTPITSTWRVQFRMDWEDYLGILWTHALHLQFVSSCKMGNFDIFMYFGRKSARYNRYYLSLGEGKVRISTTQKDRVLETGASPRKGKVHFVTKALKIMSFCWWHTTLLKSLQAMSRLRFFHSRHQFKINIWLAIVVTFSNVNKIPVKNLNWTFQGLSPAPAPLRTLISVSSSQLNIFLSY